MSGRAGGGRTRARFNTIWLCLTPRYNHKSSLSLYLYGREIIRGRGRGKRTTQQPLIVTNVSTEGDCSVVGDDDGLVCYMH